MENPDDSPSIGRCCSLHWRGWIIFFLPIIFFTMLMINDEKAFRCFYIIVAMVIAWGTELMPQAVTAMLPIVSMPLMNILPSDIACSLYFKDTLVFFLIAIIISCSIEFTGLNARVAVSFCNMFGSNPRSIHIILIVITVILSMWIPNGACIPLVYPFTMSILEQLTDQGICKMYVDSSVPKPLRKASKVATCYYLSIAYASTIGGTGNLIGSPANLAFVDVYNKQFPDSPDKIDFAHFMQFAMPMMLINIILLVVIMEFNFMGLFQVNSPAANELQMSEDAQSAGRASNKAKYNAMGPMPTSQLLVQSLLLTMVILMATRKPEFTKGWADVFDSKEMDNSSVTTLIIFLIFILPAKCMFLLCWDERSVGPTAGLLSWKYVNAFLPWDLIFIIGCGGTLAESSRKSGLARKFGEMINGFKDSSTGVVLLLLIIIVELCTNITVNAAVLAVVSPGIIQLAIDQKIHPLYYLMPSGLAGSMAFLMPTATAPNALVAIYGNIRPKEFLLAGLGPTLCSIFVIYIFALLLGPSVFPDINNFPDWIMANFTGVNYGDSK